MRYAVRKESSWNEMYGIERLVLQFKNSVDLDNVKISIQHPGRMFAPEIIDSTFTIERFNIFTYLYLCNNCCKEESPQC